MTKAQYQVKLEELESTIHCLTLEKTKLENDARAYKPEFINFQKEIFNLKEDIIDLNRKNRILLKGQ